MFCTKCGAEIDDNAQFCENCGAKVEKKKKGVSLDSTNIPGIVAGILLIFSTFFPYATIEVFGSKMSVSLIQGSDGVLVIIIGLIVIGLSFFRVNLGVVITGAISLLFAIIKNVLLYHVDGDDFYKELAKSMIQKGAGFYLLYLASVAVLCVGIYALMKQKRQQ